MWLGLDYKISFGLDFFSHFLQEFHICAFMKPQTHFTTYWKRWEEIRNDWLTRMNVIYILLYIMFCVGSEMNNFVVSVIILSCQFPKLTFKSISEDGIVTKCPDHLIGSNVAFSPNSGCIWAEDVSYDDSNHESINFQSALDLCQSKYVNITMYSLCSCSCLCLLILS